MTDFIGLVLQDAKKIPAFTELENLEFNIIFVQVNPEDVDTFSVVKSKQIPSFISPILRQTKGFNILQNKELLSLCMNITEYVPEIWTYLQSIGVVATIPKKTENTYTFTDLIEKTSPYEFKVATHFWLTEIQKLMHNIDTVVRIVIKHLSRLSLALVEVQDASVAVRMSYTIMVNNAYLEGDVGGTDEHRKAFMNYASNYAQMLRECRVDIEDIETKSNVFKTVKPMGTNVLLVNHIEWLSVMLEKIPNTSIQIWYEQMIFVGALFTNIFSTFYEMAKIEFGGPVEQKDTLEEQANAFSSDPLTKESLEAYRDVYTAIQEGVKNGKRSQKDLPVFVTALSDLLQGNSLSNYQELNEVFKRWTDGFDIETYLVLIDRAQQGLYFSIQKNKIDKIPLIEARPQEVINRELKTAENAAKLQEGLLLKFCSEKGIDYGSIEVREIRNALETAYHLDLEKLQKNTLKNSVSKEDFIELCEKITELNQRRNKVVALNNELILKPETKAYTKVLQKEIEAQDSVCLFYLTQLEDFMYVEYNIEKDDERAGFYRKWYTETGRTVSVVDFIQETYDRIGIRMENGENLETFKKKLNAWHENEAIYQDLVRKLEDRKKFNARSRFVLQMAIFACIGFLIMFNFPFLFSPLWEDPPSPMIGPSEAPSVFGAWIERVSNFYSRQAVSILSDRGHAYMFSAQQLLERFKPWNLIMDVYTGASAVPRTLSYLSLMGQSGYIMLKLWWSFSSGGARLATARLFDDNFEDVFVQEMQILKDIYTNDIKSLVYDLGQIYTGMRTAWQQDIQLALSLSGNIAGIGIVSRVSSTMLTLTKPEAKELVASENLGRSQSRATTKYINTNNSTIQQIVRPKLPRKAKEKQESQKGLLLLEDGTEIGL